MSQDDLQAVALGHIRELERHIRDIYRARRDRNAPRFGALRLVEARRALRHWKRTLHELAGEVE